MSTGNVRPANMERITSPPLKNPCYYGVDISSRKELISASKSVNEVCRFIGADSLAFISEAGLMEAGHRTDMCLACFNCQYPTDIYSHSMVAGGLDEMS